MRGPVVASAAAVAGVLVALSGPGPCALGQGLNDRALQVRNLGRYGQNATQVEFLGSDPGEFFVTEQTTGRVVHVRNRVATTALDLHVSGGGEAGLLGMALHPRFAENGFVYLYYTFSDIRESDSTFWGGNRLSRCRWDGAALRDELALRTFGLATDGPDFRPNHFGGPIAFGPDGKLYGVVGDNGVPFAESNNLARSDVSSRKGGIFRLNAPGDHTDGSVPADNPLVASPNSDFHVWYAYGVRNSFGIDFDPATGRLWDTENGSNNYDEVNLVAPGFNSGWTKIMGPDSRTPAGVNDLVHLPGSAYSDPELSFVSSIAPTDLVFLADTALGERYRDAVLVADFRGRIHLLRLNEARDAFAFAPLSRLGDLVVDGPAEGNEILFGQNWNVTDFEVGPDGALYALTYFGNLYRIVPEPSGTIAWVLAAAASLARPPRRPHRWC